MHFKYTIKHNKHVNIMVVGFKYQRAILEDHREESLHEGSGRCCGVGNCLDCANCMVEEWYHPGWVLDGTKLGTANEQQTCKR